MERVELLIVKPGEGRETYKNRIVIGLTKVGNLGYVIENPFKPQNLEFVEQSEYVEVNPKPENELEVLRKKVYDYEVMVARLLTYPDLIVIAAVKNELPQARGMYLVKSRE